MKLNKFINLFFVTVFVLSAILNAYAINSNQIIKQTNISSITANNLNVEVVKNTHLKGSLLASTNYETTTDENGNTKTKFIDNHNLNLKTNTLSYENLSNTSYNKGTNFNIGANYSLANKDEASKNNQANNQEDKFTSTKSNNNQEDKFTGIKSINLSNQRNLSYTLSKTLATLGNGNIEIANKENSDDLTRLNKDTTKPTKDLVDTSISSNIDASIDTRLFTVQGRKEIKDEYNKATAITKALSTIIQTGKLNFNQEVGQNNNTYEINKAFGDELVNILQNDKLSINEKENFIAKFTKDLAKSKGYDLRNLQIRFINDKTALGANNQPFQGNYNAQINTITLNLANISNLNDFTNTLGHELSHAIMANQNKFIPQDIKQNNYADLKGRIFTDYLNKALDLQGYDIDLSKSNVNLDYENTNNINTLINNQNYFNSVDKSKSDNSDINLFQNTNNVFNFSFDKEKTTLKIFDKENAMYSNGYWVGTFDGNDVFTITAHGGKGYIVDERYDNSKSINATELVKMIIDTPKWKTGEVKTIKILSCNSGTDSIKIVNGKKQKFH